MTDSIEFLGIGRTWAAAVLVILLATLLIWFAKIGEGTYATLVITIFTTAGGVKAYHKRLRARQDDPNAKAYRAPQPGEGNPPGAESGIPG